MGTIDRYDTELGAVVLDGDRLIEGRRQFSPIVGEHIWLIPTRSDAQKLGIIKEDGEAVYFLDEDDISFLEGLSPEILKNMNAFKKAFLSPVIPKGGPTRIGRTGSFEPNAFTRKALEKKAQKNPRKGDTTGSLFS